MASDTRVKREYLHKIKFKVDERRKNCTCTPFIKIIDGRVRRVLFCEEVMLNHNMHQLMQSKNKHDSIVYPMYRGSGRLILRITRNLREFN